MRIVRPEYACREVSCVGCEVFVFNKSCSFFVESADEGLYRPFISYEYTPFTSKISAPTEGPTIRFGVSHLRVMRVFYQLDLLFGIVGSGS